MGVPSDEDFETIKELMPSDDINKDDLFVYKVVLCDNNIDRDYEKFSHQALVQVAQLFKSLDRKSVV